MTIACACELYVLVYVIEDEILLRVEEYKIRVNLSFSEKWKKGKLLLQYMLQT